MSKKTPAIEAPRGLTAADMIAEVKARRPDRDVPAGALVALRELCDYNDRQVITERAGRGIALKMLRSWGVAMSAQSLNKLCVETLGRRSYAQK